MSLPAVLVLILGSFRGLTNPGAWHDEAFSIHHALRPLTEIWSHVTLSEAQVGGYYLTLHVWLMLGQSDAWARLLSLLATAATFVVIAVFLRKLAISPWIIIAATTAAALLPDMRWYAVDARGYALAGLFVVAAVNSCWTAQDAGLRFRIRPLVTGLLLGLAAFYNLLAILVAAVLGMVILLGDERWRNLIRLAGSIFVALVFVVPFIRPLLTSGQVDWISPVPITGWVGILTRERGAFDLLLLAGSGFLFASVLWRTWNEIGPRGWSLPPREQALSAISLMAIGPLVLLGAISEAIKPLLVTRYILYSLPFATIAVFLSVAPWWVEQTRGLKLRVVVAFAAWASFCTIVWPPLLDRPQTDEFRPAALLVAQRSSDTDVYFSELSNALARYGVDFPRNPSCETERLWRIDWGPKDDSELATAFDGEAARRGLNITGSPVLEDLFGSAYVWSAPVTFDCIPG